MERRRNWNLETEGQAMYRMFSVVLFMCLGLFLGCREEPEEPAPPSVPPPATPAEKPDVVPAPPAIDAAAEAPADLQARAAKLKALPWAELGKLQIGEEAIILIQGQTKNVGAVYGTGPYTADSFPPAAVVHAGLLKDGEWGLIRFKIIKFDGDHGGSEQNGIHARKWGKYHRSYTVELVADE